MSKLRAIAVSVEESASGRFRWVLIERGADGWQALDRAGSPVAGYQQAMAGGLLALQALVTDLDAGPRADDDEEAPAEAAPAPAPAPPAASASGSAKPYFGFGPAR